MRLIENIRSALGMSGAGGDGRLRGAAGIGAERMSDPRWPLRMSASVAMADAGYMHPIEQITRQTYGHGERHDTQLHIFHLLRQFLPTLEAAFKARRALEGTFYVESQDVGLERFLESFCEEVPVGLLSGRAQLRGLNVMIDTVATLADEYGLAGCEVELSETGREVKSLLIPPPRAMAMRDDDGDGKYEVYLRKADGSEVRLDNAPNVYLTSFSTPSVGPWPTPLAWSLVKSGEIVMRIFESALQSWWRLGDPSLLYKMQYTDAAARPIMVRVQTTEGTVEVPQALYLLQQSAAAVMAARRAGRAGDIYAFTDPGATLEHEVIGSIEQTMMGHFNSQMRYFDGLIVTHAEVPAWMFTHLTQEGDGLGSSRSKSQGLMAAQAAKKRQQVKRRLIRQVLDTMLVADGRAGATRRYDIHFSTVTDEAWEAETRKQAADANMATVEVVGRIYDEQGRRLYRGEAERVLVESGIYPGTTAT